MPRPTGMDATKTLEKRSLGAEKAGDSGLAVDPNAPSGGEAICLSVIMPTVSWEGCFEPCVRAAIEHSAARGGGGAEILVVFDGVGGSPPRW